MTMARAARLAVLLCGLAGGFAPVGAGAQPATPAPPVTRDTRPAAGDGTITVAPLRRGDAICVSFSTARAVTPAVEQAIASGLPTPFTYDVELRRPSAFFSVQSRGFTPRLIAACSAGWPKLSQPIGCRTLKPCKRLNHASASPMA